ncbi:MAG: tRNA lysidine(34) synthetase TilS [Proteobacteria bacterium]|nr:tRNA lysidine(34) synthetase TilS [Pseudomonadota bacterium]
MELDSLLKIVRDNFQRYKVFNYSSENRVVIGLSGGADSMLLYYVLKKISKDFSLRIFPVYVNHLIRDISTEEADKLSRYLKENFNERLYVFSSNVPQIAKTRKTSIEEAGRWIRYRIINMVAEAKDASHIVLGHNLDDNVETVIFRICRGTGIEGLKAMTFLDGNVIRPLIDIRKKDIVKLVKSLKLFYIEDESNQSLNYTRNRIRHKILPELLKINEKALEHIKNLSQDAREFSIYIDKHISKIIEENLLYRDREIIILKIPHSFDDYVTKEYIKGIYKLFKGDSQKIKRLQVEQFLSLFKKSASFSVNFPDDIVIERGFDFLLIRKKNYKLTFNPKKVERNNILVDNLQGSLKIDGNLKELKAHNIFIRPFEDGDVYRGKKLKTFFLEKKIPKFLRKAIPLLAKEKEILYIPLFDSDNFTISIKGRDYKLNFEEGPLYSKINQIFKS